MIPQEIERVPFKTNFLKNIDGLKLRECDNTTVMRKDTLCWGIPNIVTFSEGIREGSRREIRIG
jgi:hypothetical protein